MKIIYLIFSDLETGKIFIRLFDFVTIGIFLMIIILYFIEKFKERNYEKRKKEFENSMMEFKKMIDQNFKL